ncbi:hypothetical protein J3F83DRAFT_601178 [Trichoderma novae-zelandiae]
MADEAVPRRIEPTRMALMARTTNESKSPSIPPRQTDRQTERQTDRQRERQTDRQRDRETDRLQTRHLAASTAGHQPPPIVESGHRDAATYRTGSKYKETKRNATVKRDERAGRGNLPNTNKAQRNLEWIEE